MKTVQALQRAKNMIEVDGWIQGTYGGGYKGGGGVCLDGALRYATIWAPGIDPATREVLRFIYVGCRTYVRRAIGGMDIAYWNDRPTRIETEVLAALDTAIDLAERDAAKVAAA